MTRKLTRFLISLVKTIPPSHEEMVKAHQDMLFAKRELDDAEKEYYGAKDDSIRTVNAFILDCNKRKAYYRASNRYDKLKRKYKDWIGL